MKPSVVDRLEDWKKRFGGPGTEKLERLLSTAGTARIEDAGTLVRLHETLLFLRAYPRSREVARGAEAALRSTYDQVKALRERGEDLTPLEAPDVSGIAGSNVAAVFSLEVARRLSTRYGRAIGIDWQVWEDSDAAGAALSEAIPLLREEWPVEAHVPFGEWLRAACGTRTLACLLERPALYESLRLQLRWGLGGSGATRTRTRLPVRKLFCHEGPLIRRQEVSLAGELGGPRMPVSRLRRSEARRVLDVILDTSAVRYRELYGFTHPDAERVYRADAGRGVEIYFFGVPPERRLPLRAYHAGMFFKNGVPAGYVEVLSLFERAEVGFNLYYTFREGESAWLYARTLRLFQQELGVTCFSVDPYQIGEENEEAIESGAMWFYRKLGFRPVRPEIARLMEREERRIRETPAYRTPASTLRRMARGHMLYEAPGSETGIWDRFTVRSFGLKAARWGPGEALQLIPGQARWSAGERAALAEVVRAKRGAEERDYLRLMQAHRRLRDAVAKWGSSAG
jgi:hypothetical protein